MAERDELLDVDQESMSGYRGRVEVPGGESDFQPTISAGGLTLRCPVLLMRSESQLSVDWIGRETDLGIFSVKSSLSA